MQICTMELLLVTFEPHLLLVLYFDGFGFPFLTVDLKY